LESQTYADIEYIIVDGASTDSTIKIINNNCTRISQMICEPDKGIYDALNKGINVASGDIVGFLHSDDVFASKNIVESIVRKFESTGSNAIYGDLQYVAQKKLSKVVRYWKSGEYSRGRLKDGWMPPHPTFYMKREMYLKLGTFDLSFKIAADDLIKKDCLTTLLNLASKYPQESIFTADFEIVNGSSLISTSYCKGTESGIVSNAYKSLWEGLFFIRTGNTLIKKSCFNKVGMFDTKISYYEDMDHILRLIRDYDVVYTPKNIFTYKMEYNFLSSNPVKMSKDWTNYVSFKHKRFYEKLIIGNIIFNNIRKRFKQKDTTGALFLFRKHFWSTHYLLLAKILKKLNSNTL
jgi:glycosyltransferase involved in cell wall biosynthesis